jgi:hypothetical protein
VIGSSISGNDNDSGGIIIDGIIFIFRFIMGDMSLGCSSTIMT